MRALIDFLVNSKHWFVFFLLEGISLLALFSYNGYQKSVYFTTANEVVGSVYSFISSVTSYLNLQAENKRLEADNEKLRQEVSTLRKTLASNDIDTTKVDGLSPEYNFIGAHVIASTLHKNNNLITLDKGEADGIKPEMGVVCSSGVVGVVYMTSKHYSIVIPLLNVNSKISCRIKNSEYFGTLQWNGVRPDISYATRIPRHAKVKKYEIVETNGYSDIFPPGIPIGVVTNIGDTADGMSYKLRVALYTDFRNLRNVSIITNYTQPERIELEQKADSLTMSNDDDLVLDI